MGGEEDPPPPPSPSRVRPWLSTCVSCEFGGEHEEDRTGVRIVELQDLTGSSQGAVDVVREAEETSVGGVHSSILDSHDVAGFVLLTPKTHGARDVHHQERISRLVDERHCRHKFQRGLVFHVHGQHLWSRRRIGGVYRK